MTDLEVQHAALSHASSAIDAVHEQLTSAGHRLEDRARAYLGSGWQGRAADGFRVGYDEWSAGAREVLAAVRQMGVLVDEANQRFVGTDQSVDASMQLHIRLGGVGGFA